MKINILFVDLMCRAISSPSIPKSNCQIICGSGPMILACREIKIKGNLFCFRDEKHAPDQSKAKLLHFPDDKTERYPKGFSKAQVTLEKNSKNSVIL